MKKIETVRLSDNSRTISSCLTSFNIYDGNTFTTFFYSHIEKIWFVTVKSGSVKINNKDFADSMILQSPSTIEYGSKSIKFVNLRDEVGLSQILVEKFLRSKNSKISQEQICDALKGFKDKQLILECMERNSLFYNAGDGWCLNYLNYIEFLELKRDPLISSVLYELENGYHSGGFTKTFSLTNIWNNTQFSEDEEYSSGEKGSQDTIHRRVPNWPHSASIAKFSSEENIPDLNQTNNRLESEKSTSEYKTFSAETPSSNSDHKKYPSPNDTHLMDFKPSITESKAGKLDSCENIGLNNYIASALATNRRFNPGDDFSENSSAEFSNFDEKPHSDSCTYEFIYNTPSYTAKKRKMDDLPCKKMKICFEPFLEPVMHSIDDHIDHERLLINYYSDTEHFYMPSTNTPRARSYSSFEGDYRRVGNSQNFGDKRKKDKSAKSISDINFHNLNKYM